MHNLNTTVDLVNTTSGIYSGGLLDICAAKNLKFDDLSLGLGFPLGFRINKLEIILYGFVRLDFSGMSLGIFSNPGLPSSNGPY